MTESRSKSTSDQVSYQTKSLSLQKCMSAITSIANESQWSKQLSEDLRRLLRRIQWYTLIDTPQLPNLGATSSVRQDTKCYAGSLVASQADWLPATSYCVPLEAPCEQSGLCALPCRYLLAAAYCTLLTPRQPSSYSSCSADGVQQQSELHWS